MVLSKLTTENGHACPFSVDNQDVKKMKSKEEHSNLETTYRTIPGDYFFFSGNKCEMYTVYKNKTHSINLKKKSGHMQYSFF